MQAYAQIVERLVGVGLALCLGVVGAHRRGAGFLVHQITFKLDALASVLSFRSLELKTGVDGGLFDLRIAHLY